MSRRRRARAMKERGAKAKGTSMLCPVCRHFLNYHDERGCLVVFCDCKGPKQGRAA